MRDGEVLHSHGCGHQRVALPVDGTEGDAATVVATVELPRLDANGTPTKETKEAKEPPHEPSPSSAGKASPTTLRPARFGLQPAGPEAATGKEREVRTRTMHIQVSVSRTARETEPLVSVSSSWGGREQLERVIETSP